MPFLSKINLKRLLEYLIIFTSMTYYKIEDLWFNMTNKIYRIKNNIHIIYSSAGHDVFVTKLYT